MVKKSVVVKVIIVKKNQQSVVGVIIVKVNAMYRHCVTSCTVIYFVFTVTLQDGTIIIHFTEEDTETWRGEKTCGAKKI